MKYSVLVDCTNGNTYASSPKEMTEEEIESIYECFKGAFSADYSYFNIESIKTVINPANIVAIRLIKEENI